MTHPEPVVGMPATIHFVSDSRAAVVTKVNKKSVVVQRVATGPDMQDMNRDGADYLPVMQAEGILDQIIGAPERYSRIDTADGPRFRNGSMGISLGRSISVTDYRY